MKKLIPIILCAFIVSSASAQGSKKKVAVMEPNISSLNLSTKEGETVQQTIAGELDKALTFAGIYEVIERIKLEDIMKELNLNDSIIIDDNDRIRFGRLKGVDIICVSDVSGHYSNIQIVSRLITVESGIKIRTHTIPTSRTDVAQDCKILADKMAKDFDEPEVFFNANGGYKEVAANSSFEILEFPWWCKAEKAGETIRITCEPNKTADERKTAIKIRIDNRETTIKVSQKMKGSFVSKDSHDFNLSGGDVRIDVLVEGSYEINNVPNDWLKYEKKSDHIIFECLPNKDINDRIANIELRFASTKQPITMKQSGRDLTDVNSITLPVFVMNKKRIREIKINTDKFEFDCPSWCYCMQDGSYLIVRYVKNKSTREVSGQIKLERGNKKKTIDVTLQGKKSAPDLYLYDDSNKWGFSVGYAQRGYNLSIDKNEEISSWKQPKNIRIFQIGAKFNSFFNPDENGLGIDWGVYYEYALPVNYTAINPAGREYTYNFERHTAYIPLRLMYKFDISEHFGVFAHSGFGLDCGIYEKTKTTYSDETEPFFQSPSGVNFSSIVNRLNVSFEYGYGIQLAKMQLGMTLTNKLFCFNPEETFTRKQKNGLMFNFSLMFNVEETTRTKGGRGPIDNPFALKNERRRWGISAGYVERGYNLSIDKNEEISSWEQPYNIPIVQIGFKFNPFFAPDVLGLGIDWGLYYEYALPTDRITINPVGMEYTYSFQRHTAYIPVRLIYKFDVFEKFGFFIHGGAGLDCGIYEKSKAVYSGETEPFYQSPSNMDFTSIMNRTHISAEYGGGIQFGIMAISTTFTNRFFSFNSEETFTKKQNNGFMVNLSLLF
ncbi:MAG: hypothetical protein FWC39_10485 [Bacteroidetes bacterium]|nr:hypothetical protein [Bacteroidota bacterium]